MKHALGRLQVHDPHDDLGLEEGVGQLRVVKEQLLRLFRVVLDAPFHLLHQLEHLLRGQAGHSFGDCFWCCLWRNWGPIDRRLNRSWLRCCCTSTTSEVFAWCIGGAVYSKWSPTHFPSRQIPHRTHGCFCILILTKPKSSWFSCGRVIDELQVYNGSDF